MCMQDLAISNKMFWRKATVLKVAVFGGANYAPLQPSPNRFAAFCYSFDADLLTYPLMLMGDGDLIPFASPYLDGKFAREINIRDFPGAFSQMLYAYLPVATYAWYECISVPELGAAVNVVGQEIDRMGGTSRE